MVAVVQRAFLVADLHRRSEPLIEVGLDAQRVAGGVAEPCFVDSCRLHQRVEPAPARSFIVATSRSTAAISGSGGGR